MKKLFLYTITLLLLGSCSNLLEKTPQGQETSADYFKTQDGALKATNAIYESLRGWNTTAWGPIGLVDIASDDADKGSTSTDSYDMIELNNASYLPNNGTIQGYYNEHYQAINRTNQVIINVPEGEFDENLKARYIAEAKCLRAFFYFNLVRAYGGMPIVDRLLNPEEYKVSRSTKEETYAFIIKDLEEAVEILPTKSQYDLSELGRVTKGTAQALLAKVYLFQASFSGSNEDYQKSLNAAEALIQSGEYSLYPNFAEIFRLEGENCSESIFEVQTHDFQQGGGSSQFTEIQGIRSNVLNKGWGFNIPSKSLRDAFEANDPRYDATIITAGQTLYDGEVMPRPEDGIFGDNSDPINEFYSYKVYSPSHNGGNNNSPMNIRLLRYSDIILVAAEASNALGNSSKALGYLNSVRARARTGLNVLPDVTVSDQVQLREAIWNERRVELAMEQHRYFDLMRMDDVSPGYAKSKLVENGDNVFDVAKNKVYPIPQAEINAVGSDILKQNPNY
ncbi:RagB/SusD family nutrient uptake outer membrane protein [Flammeovirga agarivorans]|uniref:RagB/SusD family nutrient uptake outer membrane protein n=1 Tax=Flammeovirga agarivorans TaxID=2726742 RepID=A0A7X8SPS0_9BACT|nr:RagB/SusD family nutrient uptake outer membrane protein [Flammeovirga agarivorans]NLR94060.1 RagB/SusD family nutrient uptake outer membrane protein [Flammeovirga agarivorans]